MVPTEVQREFETALSEYENELAQVFRRAARERPRRSDLTTSQRARLIERIGKDAYLKLPK